jgi:uncharacterized membrane protein YesL
MRRSDFMGGLFSYDSKPVQILNFVADLIILNVLYLLCCVPIFTIGAASTAMHSTVMSICNDSCTGVWVKFFGTFKAEFKQSTKIWLGYLVALVVLVADVYATIIYPGLEESSAFLSAMKGITLFFGISFILMFTYTFAIIARYIVTWKQALRNALYLITKYPLTAIFVLLINAVHIFCYWLVLILALPITPVLLFFQEALINRLINKEQGIKKEKKRKKSDYETYDD